jgi:hypothetical protein
VKLSLEDELRCLALAGQPPRRVRESEFMRAVIRVAESQGWAVYHTHDSRRSAAGFPDLVLLRRELQLAVELKRSAQERPTAEQLAWLARFRAARVPAFVWTPEVWADVERVLKFGPRLGEGLVTVGA